MGISVLINNYNYGCFISEAIASAARQCLTPEEIIVIDDGSKDNSREVLHELKKAYPNLSCLFQQNQGQLSALRKGVEHAKGEWCALLDSDDTWTPDHLETALASVCHHNGVGIYFAAHKESSGPPLFRSHFRAVPIGPVVALAALTNPRIGSITSTIFIRTKVLKYITQATVSIENEWKTRADDIVIYGAALSGTKLFHGDKVTVNYRIHGHNAFAGKSSESEEILFKIKLYKAKKILCSSYNLSEQNMIQMLIEEWNNQRDTAPKELKKRYRKKLRKCGLRAWLACYI